MVPQLDRVEEAAPGKVAKGVAESPRPGAQPPGGSRTGHFARFFAVVTARKVKVVSRLRSPWRLVAAARERGRPMAWRHLRGRAQGQDPF